MKELIDFSGAQVLETEENCFHFLYNTTKHLL